MQHLGLNKRHSLQAVTEHGVPLPRRIKHVQRPVTPLISHLPMLRIEVVGDGDGVLNFEAARPHVRLHQVNLASERRSRPNQLLVLLRVQH